MHRLWICLFVLLLAACASRQNPSVVERSLTGPVPASHVVKRGETLYAIAVRYDMDYHDLARINRLNASYTIYPGQRLHLRGADQAPARPQTKVTAAPARPADKTPASKPLVRPDKTPVAKVLPPASRPEAAGADADSASASLAWAWPAKGQVLGGFGSPGLTGKGLDIAGRRGDSVRAAAAGTVVYAGSGLVGYGKLLIIRHDDNYISAYAHNDRFRVKEGERVKLGQVIAEMGASGTDRDKLHFEIRERGKPVDPMRFLSSR